MKIDQQRLKDLFIRMLDIYSPSGKEAEVVDFLAAELRQAGFAVERQEVDEDRCNLLLLPAAGEAEVVLVGHVDTVPAHDLDQYGPDQRGDEIWGLGTADMKGGCAAMIEALCAYRQAAPTRDLPVALALVVGEEESGDGTMALLREHQFRWAVVGEPTDLRPCFSHYSYIEMALTTAGERKHASQARKAKSAIQLMLRLLSELMRLLDKSHPEIVYNLRDLTSATAGFAVSDSCECWLDLHLPPELSTSIVIQEIEKELRPYLDVPDPDLWYSFQTIHAGYSLDEQGRLPLLLKQAYEKRGQEWLPEAFPSHSDASLLWASGVKPILFGPGDLEKAHTSEESVDFRQVVTAAELYLDLLQTLAAK